MLRLHEIAKDGSVDTFLTKASVVVAEVLNATREFYERAGFHPPWVSYLAVVNGEAVGCCSFKSVPQNGRVEIAYYTFPGCERRGVATKMAQELVTIARKNDRMVVVTARTLPGENASTAILRKLGFSNNGTVQDPEDGTVWEWVFSGQQVSV